MIDIALSVITNSLCGMLHSPLQQIAYMRYCSVCYNKKSMWDIALSVTTNSLCEILHCPLQQTFYVEYILYYPLQQIFYVGFYTSVTSDSLGGIFQ